LKKEGKSVEERGCGHVGGLVREQTVSASQEVRRNVHEKRKKKRKTKKSERVELKKWDK